METIKRLKNKCVSKIYIWENVSNFVLSSRGDKVPSLKIMRFSMFSRFAFYRLQWIIPVTEKSLSEPCEVGLESYIETRNIVLIGRLCSVILSYNDIYMNDITSFTYIDTLNVF